MDSAAASPAARAPPRAASFVALQEAKTSQAKARDRIYRGRRFEGEIIERCVRWYMTYRLSYRDLVP